MSAINELVNQIDDELLKQRIKDELNNINRKKKFGLVFEQHIPESIPIYSAEIKKGSIVSFKGKKINDAWIVTDIKNNKAVCYNRSKKYIKEFNIDELVVIKQFGSPIYPCLIPIDKVKNSKDSLWHTLIEADNYHALQLLEYLYSEKVDCIYLDPPYNTGSRDWKYNNDYVDKNDNWRHSKWLAFMERRLRLAKKLLNPLDSVLILAIDDNELFTIGLLLDEIFSGCERQIINMTINPKGKARVGRLSQVDEYLIVIYLGQAQAQELPGESLVDEIRWPYLRRSDVESARGTKKGGVRQFYPIYVDEKTEKIVKIGEPLTPEESIESVPKIEGAIPVFPIREDGKHMNWGLTGPSLKNAMDKGYVRVLKSKNRYQAYNFSYITGPSIEKIEKGIYHIDGTRPDGSKIVVIPDGKTKKSTTVWIKNLYDANAYGSQLIGELLKDKKFPFPKSLYSVRDIINVFVANKKDALILDFFAGSGTTLHAVNLINAEDNGKRRCILVTNNEVSDDEAKKMQKQGYQPGDLEWEKHGICQYITWPRIKTSILGKREDGTALTGEYFLTRTTAKHKQRNFYQLSFSSAEMLQTVTQKKQLVSMIGKEKLPQSLVDNNSKYIVSEKYIASILFDDAYLEQWISEITDKKNITDFYIVTDKNAIFTKAKKKIIDLLGDIVETELVKKPMKEGFDTNCEYFKLGFLEKSQVELGQQFKEILPMLWLKSGAVGERIEINGELPKFIIPKGSNYAVLIDETYFAQFCAELSEHKKVEDVYIVTNSEEAFREMSSQLKNKNTIQLYRDYIDNFVINHGGI